MICSCATSQQFPQDPSMHRLHDEGSAACTGCMAAMARVGVTGLCHTQAAWWPWPAPAVLISSFLVQLFFLMNAHCNSFGMHKQVKSLL